MRVRNDGKMWFGNVKMPALRGHSRGRRRDRMGQKLKTLILWIHRPVFKSNRNITKQDLVAQAEPVQAMVQERI